MEIQAGKTSKIIAVKLLDTASSTADGKTGLLHTDVTASYFREGQAAVSIALAAGAPGDAFSAGKFAEVSSTLARGHYYLHVPDAAFAVGSESVTIHLQAAGVFDKKVEISLVSYDPQDGTRLGLAALPNAAPNTANGIPVSTSGDYSDLDSVASPINDVEERLTATRAAYLDNLNGHTAQTGDSFARIGANGASLTALASQTSANTLQASVDAQAVGVTTRVAVKTSASFERPESGSSTFKVLIETYAESGELVNADSTPTLAVVNQAGIDRSANLTALTPIATGRYEATYTVGNAHALEQIIFRGDATIGATAFSTPFVGYVTDAVSVDFTSTDRTALNNLTTAIADIQGVGFLTGNHSLVAVTNNLDDKPGSGDFPPNWDGLVISATGEVNANATKLLGTDIAANVPAGVNFYFGVATPTKTMEDVGGSGGVGGGDWTTTEKNQIRHRLGVDGATATPATNAPNLDIPANLGAIVADWTDGGRLDLILDARASQTTVDTINSSGAKDATVAKETTLATKASQASVDALQTAIDGLTTGITSRIRVATAAQYEHPESGAVDYKVVLLCVNDAGVAVAPDSAPSLSAANPSGTDRSGNLSALTNPSVGRYESIYTVTNGDTLEQLIMTASATIGGQGYSAVVNPVVTDAVATDFTATDRNTLNSLVADIWSNGSRSLTEPVAANLTQILGEAIPPESAAGRMATAIQTLLDVVAPFAMTELARQGADGDTLKTLSDQLDAVTTGTSPTQLLDTTIGTVTSQTVLILNAGAPDDDVYNDHSAVITDQANPNQKASVTVADYDSATNTITLAATPGFTVAAGDSVKIVAGATGGGSCDENAIATSVATKLAGKKIVFKSSFNADTKQLQLVQRADWTSASANGPLEIPFTHAGVSDGDILRLGAHLESPRDSWEITGVVATVDGQQVGRFEISSTDLDITPSEEWRYEMQQEQGATKSPIYANQSLIIEPSHAG
ncbi:MAG: hypothetical protein AAF394_02500 [Planctomycetota bacterium]